MPVSAIIDEKAAKSNHQVANLGEIKRLQRLQKTVQRIAVHIAVQDNDGNDLCRFVAGTSVREPLPTLRALLLKFVTQWTNMHDALLERVQAAHFGHLPHNDVSFMEVLLTTGTLLLFGLKEIYKRGETGSDVEQSIPEIARTLQSLRMLQSSYEINPPNDELDLLAV